jgi:hypothetical protein
MFDLRGFLHLEKVLSDDELEKGREATQRYIDASDEELPPGFERDGNVRHLHGFAFDKCLETLTMHPGIWPVIMELTNGKPRLCSGTLQVNRPGEKVIADRLHCARDDFGWEATRYECRDGRIYSDDFVVFPYFDDVFPGDGGVVMVPGSHKSNFKRPASAFNDGDLTGELHPGVVNITPKAGDVVFMPECVTHGVLPWTPKDRIRRILVMRYRPQHKAGGLGIPEVILDRLEPEVRELTEMAHYTHVKEIAKPGRAAA